MNDDLARELLDIARTLGLFTPAQLAMRAGIRLRVAHEFLQGHPAQMEEYLGPAHDPRRPRRVVWRVRPQQVGSEETFSMRPLDEKPAELQDEHAAALRREVAHLLATVEQTALTLGNADPDSARARRDLRAALIYLDAAEGRLLNLRSNLHCPAVGLEQRTFALRRRLLAQAHPAEHAQSPDALVAELRQRIFDWTIGLASNASGGASGTSPEDAALDVLRELVTASAGSGNQLLVPAVRAAGLRAELARQAWKSASGQLVRAIGRLLGSDESPGLFFAATILATELDHPNAGLASLQLAMTSGVFRLLDPDQRSLCFAAFSRLALAADRQGTRNRQARACLYLLDDHHEDAASCLLVPGAILGRLANAGQLMLELPEMIFTDDFKNPQVRSGLDTISLVRTVVLALHQANALQSLAQVVPRLIVEPQGMAWFRCCVSNAADALLVGIHEDRYHLAASHRITGTAVLDVERRADFASGSLAEAEPQLAQVLTERAWNRKIATLPDDSFTRRLGNRCLS